MNFQKKYPFVYVEWADAESDAEWGDEKAIDKWMEKECLIYDIGWMVGRDKKYIVIASQLAHDGTFGNRTKIPRSWIRKIEKIEIRKVRRLKK